MVHLLSKTEQMITGDQTLIADKVSRFEVPEWKTESNLGNILSIPWVIVSNAFAWSRAQAQDDLEGKIISLIQLAGAPLSVLSQLFGVIFRVYEVSSWLSKTSSASLISPFFKPLAYTTLALSGIETIYFSLGLNRQLSFLSEFNKRKDHKKELVDYLFQEYLGVQENEKIKIAEQLKKSHPHLSEKAIATKQKKLEETLRQKKMTKLSRRTSSWLTKEISETFALNPSNITEKKIDEWINHIDLQAKKILIVHTVGLVAIFLLVTGVLLSLLVAPPFLAVIFTSLSLFASTANYFFEYGYVDSREWNFSFINCLPYWMLWILNNVFKAGISFEPGAVIPQKEEALTGGLLSS